MGGISNLYIESILRPTCPDFLGVFSANTIPTALLQRDKFSIVCNLSGVEEPGSHFISIIASTDSVLYIDSLGLVSVVAEISNFLGKLKKPVYYNERQVQDVSSKYCGFYCILFILYVNYPCTSVSFYDKQLLRNDVVCVKKIREILNKASP